MENALHIAADLRQLAHFVEEHVGVADGDHEWIADVVHHLGGGLIEARAKLLLFLFGLDRLVHGLELLEHVAPLFALHALGGVAADSLLEHVHIERLLEIFVRAETDGGLGGREGTVARHHDHRNFGIDLAHGLEALDAVFLRHADVHHDHRKRLLADHLQAAVHAVHGNDIEFVLKEVGDAFARPELVIDDQDLGTRRYRRCRCNR